MKNNNYYKYKLNHSAEHIFAHAVKQLYGDKVTLAVAHIEDNGFSNDSRWLEEISEKDLPAIEKKMKEIIKKDLPIVEEEISEAEARELFKNNPFKLEWLEEILERKGKITVYRTGEEYVDLCKGPHVNSTGEIGAFKLFSIAGAYWRADENNEMLKRVYGVAFKTKEELDEYLTMLEEAKERDHRKINEVMDLFTFSDLVGKGLVMYTPKGTEVKNQLRDHLLEICKKQGAMEVNIPHMAKIDLYEKSGHAKKFKDELFYVKGHYDNEYVLKPVNCPHHTQIYASRQRTYKDLPIAYVESTQQHRDEKPGAMMGLNRTISFEVDDGHTFCRPDQIKDEAIKIIKIIEEFYKAFGMWGNHWVSLSFKDPAQPEKYIGREEDWANAQRMLEEINEELGLGGEIKIGEAALYGPKIDFMLKDAFGNDRQLGTVQIDFAMPNNFGLEYIDSDGLIKTPVMLHRAILGSYQRFLAYLMESTKGAFPVWLHPEQIALIPISEKQNDYVAKVKEQIAKEIPNARIKVYEDGERMQKRIRDAQINKIPYILVLGGREEEGNVVNVRLRSEERLGEMSIEKFVKHVKEKIESKALDL